MEYAVQLEDVTKRYAAHLAVADLGLGVPTGTIYGILGPNGAGKSTTLRMVMGIIARDGGRIAVLGADPERSRHILRRTGYLPEERGLYRRMKTLDVIVFFARLKGVPERKARRAGEAWLERLGLGEWRDARIDTLSKGMQQKVQFIATLLHDPDLLVLDEPHAGLDPVNQDVLRQTIQDAHRNGRTVLLSTHNMDQAEQLCEHVCIIAEGRKVLDGRLQDIRRDYRGNRYRVVYDEPPAEAGELLRRHAAVISADEQGDGWEFGLARGRDPRELLALFATLPVAPDRFERVQPSLHEIFVQIVGKTAATHRRPGVRHV